MTDGPFCLLDEITITKAMWLDVDHVQLASNITKKPPLNRQYFLRVHPRENYLQLLKDTISFDENCLAKARSLYKNINHWTVIWDPCVFEVRVPTQGSGRLVLELNERLQLVVAYWFILRIACFFSNHLSYKAAYLSLLIVRLWRKQRLKTVKSM